MAGDVTYGALAVASRRRLLEALRAVDERLDIAALAAATGLHANTVRFHLDVLVRAGFVEEHRERLGTRGRPRTVYAPTARTQSTDGYQLLAEVLVSHLDAGGHSLAAEAAGRSWATRLSRPSPDGGGDLATATRIVAAVFTEMGFEPAVTADGDTVRLDLNACPFRALAEQHPGVVCGLHRGLLRGLVAQTTTGALDADLAPFVQPRLCVVNLSPAGLRHPANGDRQ